jgi:hypothetical protein
MINNTGASANNFVCPKYFQQETSKNLISTLWQSILDAAQSISTLQR